MSDIYQFKQEDALEFARRQGTNTKMSGKELQFKSCPYCHGGSNNDKWTFSISMNDGRFTCKRSSCGVKGNMITLAKDFNFDLPEYAKRYHNINGAGTYFRRFRKAHIEPKSKAITYLLSRGISEAICRQYEITVKDNNENLLIFPFKDENEEIRFIKYRQIEKGNGPKEFCEKNCMPILFGMNHCNLDNKTLVITEGQIDSLSVAEAGIENVVSVPIGMNGFTWIPHCWDWIYKFEKIIVFGDCEKGKITLLDEISKRFNLMICHVREEDYMDCKDANEILQKYGKDQVRKCIENAIQIPTRNIISLADVEDVDVFKIEKLSTGIVEIDKLLYGGLPFGGVTLISGKPGEGKSTIVSQILINAIEQGFKVFAYSGELPNHIFKAWLNYQVAGPAHIEQYTDRWNETRFRVDKVNLEKMSSWYRDKCFLYDNTCIDGDEEENICEIMEQSIRQYGTRVILIDNLMTALDLLQAQGTDKYEKQSLFVKKLTRIALKYNVLIMLVAHKRKNNFSFNENDEISGSGDISNLAMLTLVYEKNKEIAESQRLLKVSKNRLFGRLNTEGFILNFDTSSKRIYMNNTELSHEYGWTESDGFISADGMEDIPFN